MVQYFIRVLRVAVLMFMIRHLWTCRKESKKIKELINTEGVKKSREGNTGINYLFKLQDRLMAYKTATAIMYTAVALMILSIILTI